jgi:hypothetical protein
MIAVTAVRRSRAALWLIPAMLYAVFWFWYTPLGGPLTAAEMERFAAAIAGDDPERGARLRRFMTEDTGRQFIMVNLLDMAKAPGELPATGPGASADDLLDHYMEHMYPELLRRASHPLLAGPAVSTAMDVVGIDGAAEWTRVGLMRYRSRRDLLEIATDPRFGARHEYKVAALEKTIAFPIEPQLYLSDLRLLLALVLVAGIALLDIFAFGFRGRAGNEAARADRSTSKGVSYP